MAGIFRVVVRGQFAGLDGETRTRLLAEAEKHDFLQSSFTTTGTFTYDRRLVAFNLRYEIRFGDADLPADPEEAARTEGIDRAQVWLDGAGLGAKHLRATATDMASMWER